MAKTKEDVTGESTPRGRGRAPKSSDGVKKAYVPTGRPRGRPKSDNPKAPKTYVPTGRPRGRPKGSGKKKAAATTAAKASGDGATPKAVGRRGRPRKSEPVEDPKPKPGKRGRPGRKSIDSKAEAEAESGDDVNADSASDKGDDVPVKSFSKDSADAESGSGEVGPTQSPWISGLKNMFR
ncbi:hypothetical protein HIM_00396 [Hirsutella minnesotensis 3608]|nr:hypothetical protein HIM_00396 [Hirsutella minnesotensis 3608]